MKTDNKPRSTFVATSLVKEPEMGEVTQTDQSSSPSASWAAPALKERGWTEASIRRFLAVPDKTKPNPYYKSGPPMRLWNPERVVGIESTVEWQDFRAKSEGPKRISKKIANAKREQLLEAIRNEPLPTIRKSGNINHVRRLACESYNRHQRDIESFAYASLNDAPTFLDRITVNYLRHECSDYEAKLEQIAGKIGCGDAYELIRNRVLDAIANAYPVLRDECENQKVED